jgi:hypothetical protein
MGIIRVWVIRPDGSHVGDGRRGQEGFLDGLFSAADPFLSLMEVCKLFLYYGLILFSLVLPGQVEADGADIDFRILFLEDVPIV